MATPNEAQSTKAQEPQFHELKPTEQLERLIDLEIIKLLMETRNKQLQPTLGRKEIETRVATTINAEVARRDKGKPLAERMAQRGLSIKSYVVSRWTTAVDQLKAHDKAFEKTPAQIERENFNRDIALADKLYELMRGL